MLEPELTVGVKVSGGVGDDFFDYFHTSDTTIEGYGRLVRSH
jgi:hypothetical protein